MTLPGFAGTVFNDAHGAIDVFKSVAAVVPENLGFGFFNCTIEISVKIMGNTILFKQSLRLVEIIARILQIGIDSAACNNIARSAEIAVNAVDQIAVILTISRQGGERSQKNRAKQHYRNYLVKIVLHRNIPLKSAVGQGAPWRRLKPDPAFLPEFCRAGKCKEASSNLHANVCQRFL